MPKVSIIVAICNVGPYLEQCLDSLVNQTLDDIEILAVVVEASTDNSYAITQKYAEAYSDRLKMLAIPKGTAGAVRNLGIRKAKGKYLVFVDGDDYVEVDMLEKLYRQARKSNSDVVACRIGLLDNQTGLKTKKKARANICPTTVLQNPRVLNLVKVYMTNKLILRSIIIDNELYFPEDRWFEDMAIVYNILLCAEKIDFVGEALYWYRKNREGSATLRTDAVLFDTFAAVRDFVSFYKSRKSFDRCYPVLASISRRHLTYRFPQLYPTNSGKVRRKFLRQTYSYLDQNFADWREQLIPKISDNPIALAQTNTRFAWLLSFVPYRYFRLWRRFAASENIQTFFIWLLGARNTSPKVQFYQKSRQSTIAPNLAVFEAAQGAGMTGGLAQLCEAMRQLENDKPWRYVWVLGSEQLKIELEIIYAAVPQISFVVKDSKEHIQTLCSAELLFFESGLPRYYRKLEGQRVYGLSDGKYLEEIRSANNFLLRQKTELRRLALTADGLLSCGKTFSESTFREIFGDLIAEEGLPLCSDFTSVKSLPTSPVRNYIDSIVCDAKTAGKQTVLWAPNWIGASRKCAWGGADQFELGLCELRKEYNSDEYEIFILPHPATYQFMSDATKKMLGCLPSYLNEFEVAQCFDVLNTNRSELMQLNQMRNAACAKSHKVQTLTEVACGIVEENLPSLEERLYSEDLHVVVYAGKITRKQIKKTQLTRVLDMLLNKSINTTLIVDSKVGNAGKKLFRDYDSSIEILYDLREPSLLGREGRIWNHFVRTVKVPSPKIWNSLRFAFFDEYKRRFGRRKFSHYIDLAGNEPFMLALFSFQEPVKCMIFKPRGLNKEIEVEQELHQENRFELQKFGAVKQFLKHADYVYAYKSDRTGEIIRILEGI